MPVVSICVDLSARFIRGLGGNLELAAQSFVLFLRQPGDAYRAVVELFVTVKRGLYIHHVMSMQSVFLEKQLVCVCRRTN